MSLYLECRSWCTVRLSRLFILCYPARPLHVSRMYRSYHARSFCLRIRIVGPTDIECALCQMVFFYNLCVHSPLLTNICPLYTHTHTHTYIHTLDSMYRYCDYNFLSNLRVWARRRRSVGTRQGDTANSR